MYDEHTPVLTAGCAQPKRGDHGLNILRMLGLENRAQVAVWAAEHGLLAEAPAARGALQ